jgi:hypothetical protein
LKSKTLVLAAFGLALAILCLSRISRERSRPVSRHVRPAARVETIDVRQIRARAAREAPRTVDPVRDPRPSKGKARVDASPVTFAPPPGRYPGPLAVSISASPPSASIRYTLDCGEPTGTSLPVEGPLQVDRSVVIRACAFDERSGSIGRPVSGTYFIEPAGESQPLPVFAISLDPEDFRFVQNSGWIHGREAERPAHLEVFDARGTRQASAGFGIRLHGGYGRKGGFETKKAYRAYFRKAYGAGKLRYPVISDAPAREFDKLVLRSGYNDRLRPGRGEYNVKAAYIRDEVIRDLHRDMGCPASHGGWCFLYVNLDFRGLYNVVERIDEEFLGEYAGGKEWDVINTDNGVIAGTAEEWWDLAAFLSTLDLSRDEDYAELGARVDIPNYTAYIILNLWAQNYDWPYNNWYAARKREAGARWIFLEWDSEWGLGLRPWGYSAASIPVMLGDSRGGFIRDLFAGLLSNETYRKYFLAEVRRHLEGALRPENVLRRIRRERDLVAPAIELELDSFYERGALPAWKRNIAEMETFARLRGAAFERHARSSIESFGYRPTGAQPSRTRTFR